MQIVSYLIYLLASGLFIFGIKRLASPKTARQGNALSVTGMFLAVVITLFDQRVLTFEFIIVGLVVGALIGSVMALKVPMTGMPQMVGLLNGFGGGASALVAFAEYYYIVEHHAVFQESTSITMVLSVLIGAVTFTGSLIAFGKLQGIVTGKVVKYPLQNPVNVLLMLAVVVAGVFVVIDPVGNFDLLVGIVAVSLVLGVLLVLPIGGADMPVAISLLNSYSGIAASMTGFVLSNNMLIIAGALVGASGIILTIIMCKGMNRSLMNVVLGGWESAGGGGPAASVDGQQKTAKSVDAEEAAMLFESAQNVVIVPGYGMAVAQAQHAVRDLANILEEKGINVRFAIHPVAGRMPGHMNVLLAEAQVSYDKLFALEDINDDFNNVDIAFIVGANDVVNPAARHDKNSPIFGMPILNVDYAKTVIINKRSLNVGYAGIGNDLFYQDNSLMYFGDAKSAISKLVNEIKEL
ncbi:MAG: NAD(P)(+) transhydrogenase (Re/Si-specific) subunit beta [Melioribacteraceae bacterium]|nr:NAD(P)(+) transhydrogenase (Re/Si-specific) subunit beta [Melioribacteraceae bacterium]MCF8354254.1 NAD(P)(+) transhydrogenase (Re/Si-specific) subunit beta [Melioribacteraceae bacterium]MCF8394818.1 NAD(P)(+) transhydrogenase (Re/Si-specific) subunit beta [Melioribacteraceae bacterium]MCF8417985.1 NAD(P)(+) transhydrogenase (Re/Si-specific) subunit beta [Melioribacteraceae bacterium]